MTLCSDNLKARWHVAKREGCRFKLVCKVCGDYKYADSSQPTGDSSETKGE